MRSTQEQLELMDRLRVHAEQYASASKTSYMAMQEVFDDLEVEDQEQRVELESVMTKSLGIWSAAVGELKGRQAAVREHIQNLLSTIMTIKTELGADNPAADADLQRLQGNRSAHRTLRAWEVDVLSKANYWETAKQQRLAEHEDLQARIKLLRQLCGMPTLPPPIEKPDISRSNMEFLKLELERLAAEKERREDLIRRQLDDLGALCADLGEEVKAAVMEVHPNLVYIWDAEAARVLRDVYRLGSSYSSTVGGMVDLGDTTISRLGSKILVMKDLKASRGAHASELLSVLNSLWDATDVPDHERSHFLRMMSGPLRLHGASLEKCMAEVRRLEDMRYQQMVDLVLAKGAELTALCKDSHVAEPAGLQEALTAIHSNDRNPGAAAELLAKLLQMLAEVQVLTAKRATIIAAINSVEAARQEEEWLAAFESDEQRYKGRDANKKLQRAIKAGKLRDKLPAMVQELRDLLAEWKDCEGEPFLFDGRDYEFEVLDGLAAAVEEAAAARAAKATRAASNRRLSLTGGAPTSPSKSSSTPRIPRQMSATTPLRKSFAAGASSSSSTASAARGGGVPRAPSACASPAPRRAGGPSTPMPLRGVSNCSLRERHSICVVRGTTSAAAGPASLSRSGEVRLRPDAHSTQRGGSSSSGASRRASFDSPSAKAAARRSSSEGLCSRSPSTAGGADSSSYRTPPPQQRRLSKDAHSTTPELCTTPATDSSCKRVSTSSKLNSIFTRSSVQHPVATLAAEGSGAADSGAAADQDV